MSKKGLDSFLLDTKFTSEVEILRSRFGNNGLLALITLWQKIYREHGYYLIWNDDTANLFCINECHWERSKVDGVVRACLRQGLFSSEKYRQYQTLTSPQIQERYLKARSRSSVEIEESLLLLPNPEKCCKNVKIVAKKFGNVTKNERREEKRREEINDDDKRQFLQFLDLAEEMFVQTYNLESSDRISNVKELVTNVVNVINDPELLKNIYQSSKGKAINIYRLAWRIQDPFMDELDPLNVSNKEGYLLTSLKNLYGGSKRAKSD